MGKIVNIFAVDISSSVHIGNERKGFLILGNGSTQALDVTTLTAEAQYTMYSS